MTATTTSTAVRSSEIAKARAADERIAAAWDVYHEATAPIDAIEGEIRQARRRLRTYAGSPVTVARYEDRIEKLTAAAEALRPAAAAAREAAVDLDRELYEGWTRFFFVQHIHNSLRCSSFRPTTRIAWLPDVSGLTEVEAVAAHGETLCTKCFPTAPVELTTPRPDPTLCAGSGKALDASKLTGRENAYYSPTGTCRECGETVGLTSRNSGRIRKHKAPAA